MIYIVGSNLETEHSCFKKTMNAIRSAKVDTGKVNVIICAGGALYSAKMDQALAQVSLRGLIPVQK